VPACRSSGAQVQDWTDNALPWAYTCPPPYPPDSTMPAPRQRPRSRAPGRPRSAASRDAILKAAYQILNEGGFAGFTVEGVAARAGAGKATIYRWWQSKGTLAIEAFLVALTPRFEQRREPPRPSWTCVPMCITPPASTAAAPGSCCAS
jgi:AcrR family transcriptional regulator